MSPYHAPAIMALLVRLIFATALVTSHGCWAQPTNALRSDQLLLPSQGTSAAAAPIESPVAAAGAAAPTEFKATAAASLLRPVDSSEPDALLKFIVSELERSKRDAGTLAPCEGIEVARIVSRPRQVENGVRYSIELKVKPVHIVTDRCNNNAVKDLIPSTLEECRLEVWEGMGPIGNMHPMAILKSTCKLQKD